MTKRKNNIKMPWEEHPEIWKTESSWWTYLRGCLRKAWNRNPVKISLINKNRYQIPNPNPKAKKQTVWGFKCSCCGNEYPIKNGQVDHLKAAGALNCVEDISPFIQGLLFVSESDLALICKACHGIKTHSERNKISFEQARAEKEAIILTKSKKDLQFLTECGIIPASSQQKRREQIVEYLLKEGWDG